MKKALSFILLGLSLTTFSQGAKTVKTTTSKNGSAKISKVAPDLTIAQDEARIIFSFIGPDGKPARSHIKIVCNNDSAWPTVDANGNYTAELDPGKYKLRFSVPFWHEIITDSINCKKKTATTIVVKFEPVDIKAGAIMRH